MYQQNFAHFSLDSAKICTKNKKVVKILKTLIHEQ